MESLGVERIYIEKASGKDTERKVLKEMLDYVREKDTVVVESISRLARNTKDLLEIVGILEKKGVVFISKKENVDTNTTMGKFVLTIFGAIAELEREYTLDRQKEGIAIAKEQGKYHGRKPKELIDFEKMYCEWKENKVTVTLASQKLGISRSTFYRKVEEYEKKNIA